MPSRLQAAFPETSVNTRLMTEDDVSSVLAIQAQCYVPGAIESEAAIRARLLVAPECAWIAEDAHGVCAYLVGYPSELGKVTPLGSGFLPACEPTTLYLHDLAVSPRVAGAGVGSRLVGLALATARRRAMPYSALVAIQDAAAFWRGLGYEEHHVPDAAHAAHLRTYPGQALYMARKTMTAAA